MKITLLNSSSIFTYDNECVYVDNARYAYYTTSGVSQPYSSKPIGSITRINGDTYGCLNNFPTPQIRTNIYDHTLRSVSEDEIVATYEGTPAGAIACFLVYQFLEYQKKENVAKNNSLQIDNVVTKKNIQEKPKTPVVEKHEEQEIVIPKKIYKPDEPVYKPEQHKYEEHKKEDYTPPKIPVPSGGNSENNTGGGCLVIIIAIVLIFFAIKLIPQSWKDLATYIPQGDTGITICFFSSVIGAILAIVVASLKKYNVFSASMSTFLGVCFISVIINTIIQIDEILQGTHEFIGSSIIDIPLALFASVLGQFQFALPIGIGVLIICGIIHIAKKK